MTPKTPDELKKQIEEAQKQPASPGHERTAEGIEVPTPKRRELLENLEKAAEPDS